MTPTRRGMVARRVVRRKRSNFDPEKEKREQEALRTLTPAQGVRRILAAFQQPSKSMDDLVNGVVNFVKAMISLDPKVLGSQDVCRSFEAGILARIGVGDGDESAAPVYKPASDEDHSINRRIVARLRQHAVTLKAVYPAAKFLVSFREVGKKVDQRITQLTDLCVSLDPEGQLSTAFKMAQAVINSSPRKSRRVKVNAASLAMSLHSMNLRVCGDRVGVWSFCWRFL